MQLTKDDNTVFVLKEAIKSEKIKVSETTIEEFLLTHPHYPSLKSVCDALKKWNIVYAALNLQSEEIKELGTPFIAHLKAGQLVLVKCIENDTVYWSSGSKNKITEPFGKFAEKTSGAVVVIEKKENSGEKSYRLNRQNEFLDTILLPFAITIILLFAFNLIFKNGDDIQFDNWRFWGLLGAICIGFAASVFLVLHEFKISTPIADKLCGFSTKTDCDAVLHSNASKLFGWINWADAGIVWFTGMFLSILAGEQSFPILSWLSLAALPYPVFSIWYQGFRLKKWCPFCLLVQFSLIVVSLLLIPFLTVPLVKLQTALSLLALFFLPGTVWLTSKAWLEKKVTFEKTKYSYYAIKRDPEFFRFSLTKGEKQLFILGKHSLLFGNPNAPVTVTAFLSLYCGPCTSAFKQLKALIENCPEINLNIVFSVYPDTDSQKLINSIYKIYSGEGAADALNWIGLWYSTEKERRKNLLEEVNTDGFVIATEVGETNSVLFKEYNIAGTPTVFVNGYTYPRQYEYVDIEYYTGEIISMNKEN